MEFRVGIAYGQTYLFALNSFFAKVEIDYQRLALSSLLRSFRFNSPEVVRISEWPYLFSEGLRIEHSNRDYPPFIAIWAFDLTAIKNELSKNDFKL
jgi:hypothetical protein